jgi:hypothetical protein
VLCSGARRITRESQLRFAALSLTFEGTTGTSSSRPHFVEVEMQAVVRSGAKSIKRLVDNFPMLVPLTDSSMAHADGGYRVNIRRNTSLGLLKSFDIEVGPTVHPADGMTFVISGVGQTAYLTVNPVTISCSQMARRGRACHSSTGACSRNRVISSGKVCHASARAVLM